MSPRNAPRFDALPDAGYIRQRQLIPDVVPMSSATLWRKVKNGSFPKPHKLAENISAWSVAEVRTWLASRKGA